jgi:hypothetical protein
MEVRWCAYRDLITILGCKGIFTYLFWRYPHTHIYMYIYNYIYLYASGDQVVCAHKPYYYLYILHSTHEIFYISKINNETFYPLGVGVASGPSAPYGTRLGTDGSGL